MTAIIHFKMNDKMALDILRECAEDSGRVMLSPHAKQRMKQRKITAGQIISCLKKGSISESPSRDVRGDWKCTVTYYTAGDALSVAAAIKTNEKGDRVVVVTVF